MRLCELFTVNECAINILLNFKSYARQASSVR